MTSSVVTDDVAEVQQLVRTLLAAFVSGPETGARLHALRTLFVGEAVIVRTCGDEPLVMDLDAFIAPREALLTGGHLVDFSEWELAGHTEVFGDIAHHTSTYAKAGVQDGSPFTGRGMKHIQCVRTARGWRISALAWDDERDGLAIVEPSETGRL